MENNEVDYSHKEIPENSKTLLIDDTTSRFSSAVWYEEAKNKEVTLIGCGGINSWAALLLSRLKLERLTIFDPDVVETANMSGQLYRTSNVGDSKVNAIIGTIREYSNYYNVNGYICPFTINDFTSTIMICGLDNMRARSTAFNNWKNTVFQYGNVENKDKFLFIDGRLSADEFQVFAIQGNDDKAMYKYEKEWLFSDFEAEETICSFKQTSFMANMIASVMVNIFVNFIANQVDAIIPREVPFLTRYSSDNMFFKIED